MANMVPFGRRKNGLVPSDFFRSFFGEGLLDEFFNNDMMPTFAKAFRADIKENEKEFVVEAELPGINKEQIEVQLQDNVLTISAKQDDVINEEKDNYIRRERHYGELCRSFVVDNIRTEEVKAEYKDGILKVKLPKKAEEVKQSRKIDIH